MILKTLFNLVIISAILWIIFSVSLLIFKFFVTVSNMFSIEFLGPSIVLSLLVLFLAARKQSYKDKKVN